MKTRDRTPATSGRSGLFLVLEGVEGCGKSSQMKLLSARLQEMDIPHLAVREPGETPAGERARATVLDRDLDMTPETELLLYLASRAEFVRRVVGPALKRNELVLSDRYELSTLAYQGIARELGLERVRALNEFATGGLKPDATFLLSVDPRVGRGRQRHQADRLEGESDAFHARVAAAYDELAASEPDVIPVDGSGSPEAVQRAIWEEMIRRWPDRFAQPAS